VLTEPIWDELRRRDSAGQPLLVGVIGAGFFGAGAVRQLARVRGLEPTVVANRSPERAVAALSSAGIDRARIVVCEDLRPAREAIASGRYVVTSNPDLPCQLDQIEVVLEATGNVAVGARVALAALAEGKHLVAANIELQATLGPLLKRLADRAGVVYSDVDGDQPGAIMGLLSYCRGLGLTPLLAGNCKGFLNLRANPTSQAAFARANNIAPWIATAAADGTKINQEMAVVANATGMLPARPGMTGISTSLDACLDDLARHGLLDRGPTVEYTFGIPTGVFVVARTDDPYLRQEFRYLKLGDGPQYLFYENRVVCHFDVPLTVARTALFRSAAVTPLGPKLCEVVTCAKRDLAAGESLDGIGGYDCYGVIETASDSVAAAALPIGLAEGCVLRRPCRRDQRLTWEDVDPPEGLVFTLWREQEAMASRNEDAAWLAPAR
jgi:predicted homoserine dehydrogenase-like protein